MLEQHALLLTHIVVFVFTMFQFGKLSNITDETNAQLLQRKYHASVQSLVMQDCSGTARFTGYLQISNTRRNSRNVAKPMPNVIAALSNIGGALCSTPQSLADAHY